MSDKCDVSPRFSARWRAVKLSVSVAPRSPGTIQHSNLSLIRVIDLVFTRWLLDTKLHVTTTLGFKRVWAVIINQGIDVH